MTVYIDELLLNGLLTDAVVLAAAGCAVHKRLSPKIFAGAALGAVYSAAAFFASGHLKILTYILHLPTAALMCRISFGRLGIRQLIKCTAVLYAAAFAAGGIMYTLVYYFGQIPRISYITWLCCSLAVYPIIRAIMYISSIHKSRRIYRVEIRLNSRSVTLDAIMDTGNDLRDTISRRPAILAEWSSVKPLFDEDTPEKLILHPENYRLYFIPYRSVGGSGVLTAAECDIRILPDGGYHSVPVAFYNGCLSNGEYSVLLNENIGN